MNPLQAVSICLVAVLAALSPGAGAETPIYKSIGKDGAVTYSSKPPADAVEVQPLALPPPPAEQSQAEALERTAEQKKLADELAEARKQREAERAEARKAQQPPLEVSPNEPKAREEERDYYPYRYGWPWYGPGMPPRPIHPGYRPDGPRPDHRPRPSPLPSPPPMPSPPPLPSGLEWPEGRGVR